ncbi:25S rRNA (adenine645-N1)-methyltransferase [Boothiomyces macroporosus]|uniref:Ribosomal RNA-processing protein 8 n=1 Tax=Boothiomyces macroporosus TaxID=261099 RepID=A0AAD5URY6_9FUNG|nr:25S rRNA (adenine645-N1)-methyltransferase [Boothiomyces macroporosus]
MLWATGFSLLIYNTGLPLGVIYSFVLVGLGWTAIMFHQVILYKQAVKNVAISEKQDLLTAIDQEKGNIIANRTPLERIISLKTLHGSLMFVSWLNIAGRLMITNPADKFECYAYPAFKAVDTQYFNGSLYNLTAIETTDPNAKFPWKGWEGGWAVLMSLDIKEQNQVELEKKKSGSSTAKHIEKKPKLNEIKKPQKVEKKLTTLQEKYQKKLTGSKFRWLNETLYTTTSKNAIELFQKQPELFDIYHQGFSSQVEDWPTNPVDIYIDYLRQKENIVVADMGCGEAKIARELHQKLKIHSFDLVARNEFITACDISKVPLKKESVDVVIFCLSLMGTNFTDFLNEAHRILKKSSELKVCEVKSRISDLKEFIVGVENLGFKLTKKDEKNKMFVLLDFTKTEKKAGDAMPVLKPCLYKKR